MAELDRLHIDITDSSDGARAGLTRLIQSLDRLNSSLSRLGNAPGTQQVLMNNKRLGASAKRTAEKFSLMNKAMMGLKVGAVLYIGRRIGRAFSGMLKESNMYVENMNLFTISMGNYANEALEYAEKVQGALGVDTKDFIRTQGLVMNLATGFGVAEDKAYQMSRGITQLSYDFSSFYNIPHEQAVNKLFSAIGGQLEPIRKLGYAVDAQTLQMIAHSMGIEKTVANMTQMEKSQLRYIAIMEQASDKQGDMGRTLITPANASRILEMRITRLKRAIGQGLTPAFITIVPYVQAFVEVLTRAFTQLALFLGFELPEIDYSDLDMSGRDFISGLEDATEASEALKRSIMGFDQVHLLDEPGSGVGVDLFDSMADVDLSQYDYDFLGDAETRIADLADSMERRLKPLLPLFEGFGIILGGVYEQIKKYATDYLYPWLLSLSGWADKNPDTLHNIGKGIGAITTGLVGFKVIAPIIKLFGTLGKALSGIAGATGLKAAFKAAIAAIGGAKLAAITGGLALVGFAIYGVIKYWDEIKIAWGNLQDTLSQMPEFIGNVWENLKQETSETWGNISDSISGSKHEITDTLKELPITAGDIFGTILDIGIGWGKEMFDIMDEDSETILTTVSETLQEMPVNMSDILDNTTDAIITFGETATERAFEIGDTITDEFKEGLKNIPEQTRERWELTKEVTEEIWDGVIDWLGELPERIGEIIGFIIGRFTKWGHDALDWIEEELPLIISAWVEFFKELPSKIGESLTAFKQSLKSWRKKAVSWVKEEVPLIIEAIVDYFKEMPKLMVDIGKDMIKSLVKGIKDTIGLLGDIFTGFGSGFSSGFTDGVKGSTGGKDRSLFDRTPLGSLLASRRAVGDLPSKGELSPEFVGSIGNESAVLPSMRAVGGFPSKGELFFANEQAPELVGSIGNKTAVANDQQITTALKRAIVEGFSEVGGGNDDNRPIVLQLYGGEEIKFERAVAKATNNNNRRYGR